MGQWETDTISLSGLLGDADAYVALRFHSDGDGVDLGAFLDDVEVRVMEDVEASFVASASSVCTGGNIFFSDRSQATSGIAGVEWGFGDGLTSTLSVAEHVYAQAGTYTVWLTATSNAGVSDAVSTTVTAEAVDASIEPGGTIQVCQGAAVTFDDTSTVTGTVALRQWTFSDDGSTDTSPSVVHTFSQAGTYTVSLTVTTAAECQDTAQTVVIVRKAPSPQIQVSDASPEVGATVYFTDTGSGGQTWQWDFGDGTVTAPQASPSASHAYARGGLKTVVLTVTAASGCSSVEEYRIGVLEDVFLPIVGNDKVQVYEDDFSDSSSGWPTWEKRTSNENHRGGYLIDRDLQQFMAELVGDDPEAMQAMDAGILAEEPEVYYSVVHDAWDRVFVSGPLRTQSGDFVYEFQARYTWTAGECFAGNEYGLLISQEQVNPADAHTIHGYVFSVEINPKVNCSGYNDAGWVLERWSRKNWSGQEPNGSDHDNIKGPHTTSVLDSAIGKWNTIKLSRSGSVLRVYINDRLIAETTDGTYTGPMYIGFYAEHTGSGATELSYDVMYEWDDVWVESQ